MGDDVIDRHQRLLLDLATRWQVPVDQLEQIVIAGDATRSASYERRRILRLRHIARMLERMCCDADHQADYLKHAAKGFKSPWQRLLKGAEGLDGVENDLENMSEMMSSARNLFPNHPYPHIALWNELLKDNQLPDPYGTECLIKEEIDGGPLRP